MKVLTFNLRTDWPLDFKNRWQDRKDIVCDLIRNSDFDIIGVQELNNKMFKDITSELSEYNFVGYPRSSKYFVERNDIMVSRKHRILEYDTFWLSEKPEKKGSSIWYSVFPRICTTALIYLEQGDIIRVYNTHLDFLLPKAREYGLKKISQHIEQQYKKEGYPAILMGDFNATPFSTAIREFSQGKYSDRKLTTVHSNKKEIFSLSTMSNFKGKEKGLHIDYIFATEEFKVKDSGIIYYNRDGKYPSDHYPVYADLKIK